ncbi:MAG: hypothetical protein FD159_535 [Syntrophaceae bacterium]|nr:MAG: hypothetical protein FD159_535 [Syntrophaceae bacterium]
MTMVASLFIQRWPILIGDLLISSPGKNDKFCLPTVNDNLPKIDIENMHKPVGLRQKAVVINNNLAVCWANSAFYAKRVIKDLISEYKDKICSIDEMLHYLDNIDPEIRENVSIVGMLRHNNLFHAFGFNCGNKQLNDNGDIIYIAGSGTEEFLQTFDAYNLQPQENLNPLQYAVSTLIAQYNYMMCKEISSIDSLVNCYGGGYELISYMNGGFQRRHMEDKWLSSI